MPCRATHPARCSSTRCGATRAPEQLLTTRQIRARVAVMVDEFPKIISVDDHVIEPPNLWQDRLPASYRDIGPRVVFAPKGDVTFRGGRLSVSMGEPGSGPDVAWWRYEELRRPLMRLDAAGGHDPGHIEPRPVDYDGMRPGALQGPRRWSSGPISTPPAPRSRAPAGPLTPPPTGASSRTGDRAAAPSSPRSPAVRRPETCCGRSGRSARPGTAGRAPPVASSPSTS